ncbi:hypothetical protein [Streptomyces sp. NPDC096152]|uniref:hypothetical protein n=1 Tax=Streptomyces sp. NPDC096152 TaxID=3366078 RepID=UPI003821CD5C
MISCCVACGRRIRSSRYAPMAGPYPRADDAAVDSITVIADKIALAETVNGWFDAG